jgi:hypothetical protein
MNLSEPSGSPKHGRADYCLIYENRKLIGRGGRPVGGSGFITMID